MASKLSVLDIILGIFLPFIAVLLKKGLGKDFLINVILCILFWLPGVIHAFWVMTR